MAAGLPNRGEVRHPASTTRSSTKTLLGNRRGRGERGAAVVEFALTLPAFMCLLLGMFTGGIAYDAKQDVMSAAREGARYGATLPVQTSPCATASGTTDLDQWLKCVSDITVKASSGSLNVGKSGRYICVSYVNPSGIAGSNDVTKSRIVSDSGGVEVATTDTRDCFTINGLPADGMASTKRRVQVVTKRTSKLEAMLYSQNLTLSSSSVTVFEAT